MSNCTCIFDEQSWGANSIAVVILTAASIVVSTIALVASFRSNCLARRATNLANRAQLVLAYKVDGNNSVKVFIKSIGTGSAYLVNLVITGDQNTLINHPNLVTPPNVVCEGDVHTTDRWLIPGEELVLLKIERGNHLPVANWNGARTAIRNWVNNLQLIITYSNHIDIDNNITYIPPVNMP